MMMTLPQTPAKVEASMQVTIDTEAIAAAVGAICGAAGAAIALGVRVARPVRRHIERFRLFAEDWEGEPARYDGAVPERPGMMKRMAALESEFRPNGGNSTRDRLDVIERRQIEHENAHQAAAATVATLSKMNGSEAA